MLLGGPLLSAQIELIKEIGRNIAGAGASPDLPPLINFPAARPVAGQPHTSDATAPVDDNSYGSPANAGDPGQSLAGRSLLGLRLPVAPAGELLRAAAQIAHAQEAAAAAARPGSPAQRDAAALPRAGADALPPAYPATALPGAAPQTGKANPGYAATAGPSGKAAVATADEGVAAPGTSRPKAVSGQAATPPRGSAPMMASGTRGATTAGEPPDRQEMPASGAPKGILAAGPEGTPAAGPEGTLAAGMAEDHASRRATVRPGDPAQASVPIPTSAEVGMADGRPGAPAAGLPDASAAAASKAGMERTPDAALVERALAGLGFAATAGAAPPQPATERAGVLASFILNAHFLPGWPPPRPIEQPEVRQFTATLDRALLGPEELEALEYLARLGLTVEQLRRLARLAHKARKRSKFLDAVAGFFVSLGALLTTLQEELENIADEQVADRRIEAEGSGRRERIALL